jgi:hypothetical protein
MVRVIGPKRTPDKSMIPNVSIEWHERFAIPNDKKSIAIIGSARFRTRVTHALSLIEQSNRPDFRIDRIRAILQFGYSSPRLQFDSEHAIINRELFDLPKLYPTTNNTMAANFFRKAKSCRDRIGMYAYANCVR